MNQKTLLAALAVLLAVFAIALAIRGRDDAPPSPDDAGPAMHAVTDRARALDATASDATADSSNRAADAVSSRGATGVHANRPFRDDAEWVTVRVIDKATGDPVGGATVHWFDEAGSLRHQDESDANPELLHLVQRTVETMAEACGWRTTTDANGNAQITRKGWIAVAADHEGRYGFLHVEEHALKPAKGFVVELQPDRVLQVRVVDDRGSPAPGVAIAVGKCGADLVPVFAWGWSACGRTNDPDGTLTIRHLQLVLDEMTQFDQFDWLQKIDGPWRAFVMEPGLTTTGQTIDLLEPSPEIVELRLPPCGSVRVRAELGGQAIEARHVTLNHSPAESEVGSQSLTTPSFVSTTHDADPDGQVRFPYVPLGQDYAALCDTAGGLWKAFAGPVARDQEIAVVITATDGEILLRGRLLTENGAPVGRRKILLQATGPQRDHDTEFRTDDAGRFVVSLGSTTEDDQVHHLWFDLAREGEPTLRATATGRVLRAGTEELGDLRLENAPLICSGRFVSGDRGVPAKLGFGVEGLGERTDGAAEQWVGIDGVLLHQGDAGEFTVRGPVDAFASRRGRLSFDESSMLPREPVEFAVGATGLVIPIDPGQRLAASILLPRDTNLEAIVAMLVPATPPVSRGAAPPDPRLQGHPWPSSTPWAPAHVEWPSLAPGTYTLEICITTCDRPMVRIPDIVVPQPVPGDPRLEGIDLRASTRVVRARVTDAIGEPVTSDGMVTIATADTGTRRAMSFWGPEPRFLVPSGPADLLFVVSGHRPARVRCEGDRVDVKVDAWPTIDIVVAVAPGLPEDATLVATLQPIDPVATSCVTQWHDHQTFQPFAPSPEEWTLADGRATLPIGEGRYELQLAIRGERAWVQLNGVTPREVLATARSVTATVPQAAWDSALKQLASPDERANRRRTEWTNK